MGLRLKRFRAKLNWKTKETVPEVICLSYHSHSEFQDHTDPLPTTLNTTNNAKESNEATKIRNKTSRSTIQDLFEIVPTSITEKEKNTNSITNNNEKIDKNSTNPQISLPERPLRGILKKSVSIEENERNDINNQNTVLKEPSLLYSKVEYSENNNSETNDNAIIDHKINDKIMFKNSTKNRKSKVVNSENVDSEENNTAVHCRETVIETKSNLQINTISNGDDSFNNHSGNHKNKECKHSETENNSRNNEDKTQTPVQFFAGEYSEPAYIPKYLKNRGTNNSTKF